MCRNRKAEAVFGRRRNRNTSYTRMFSFRTHPSRLRLFRQNGSLLLKRRSSPPTTSGFHKRLLPNILFTIIRIFFYTFCLAQEFSFLRVVTPARIRSLHAHAIRTENIHKNFVRRARYDLCFVFSFRPPPSPYPHISSRRFGSLGNERERYCARQSFRDVPDLLNIQCTNARETDNGIPSW